MKIQLLTTSAKVPTRGSDEAAGYDLYADVQEVISIEPNETKLIPTGISIALPKGTFGGIYARSGLALKQGLRPANCVGVIDSDYRGPVGVALHNDSGVVREINPGDRIAQLIIQNYTNEEFEVVDTLDGTERGSGGFGSTGVN